MFQYTKLMQLISDTVYSTSNLRDEPSRGFPVIVRDFMFYTRLSSCFHEINWKLVAMKFSCSILCVCVCGGGGGLLVVCGGVEIPCLPEDTLRATLY